MATNLSHVPDKDPQNNSTVDWQIIREAWKDCDEILNNNVCPDISRCSLVKETNIQKSLACAHALLTEE